MQRNDILNSKPSKMQEDIHINIIDNLFIPLLLLLLLLLHSDERGYQV